MMSRLPHVRVYVASFWSANECLLTPHGCVFHALLWGPIRAEASPIARQITAAHLAPLLHSIPGFHTDNMTINLPQDIQPYHVSVNYL